MKIVLSDLTNIFECALSGMVSNIRELSLPNWQLNWIDDKARICSIRELLKQLYSMPCFYFFSDPTAVLLSKYSKLHTSLLSYCYTVLSSVLQR